MSILAGKVCSTKRCKHELFLLFAADAAQPYVEKAPSPEAHKVAYRVVAALLEAREVIALL